VAVVAKPNGNRILRGLDEEALISQIRALLETRHPALVDWLCRVAGGIAGVQYGGKKHRLE